MIQQLAKQHEEQVNELILVDDVKEEHNESFTYHDDKDLILVDGAQEEEKNGSFSHHVYRFDFFRKKLFFFMRRQALEILSCLCLFT